ncbi:hypothetical protein FHQ18_08660 [Deferribacter autotrophicus]|uniref:Uncharacterized protein n=1 Tax=Deferribacter autotrophicus TaxID=500465 RepID=A0A5A8F2W6_9BACT|nr:hypothetical protein [Deferribacter autotrophicus]KAA0257804.1 hypothetical protein FHQ18_08660 [Deferribacter autotrophicus]
MRAICKSCNTFIDFKEKGTTVCKSCGAEYKYNKKPNVFDVKLLNGLLLEKLSFNDVKDGILNSKFLSMDYVAYESSPWIRIKDSLFNVFFKDLPKISGGQNSTFWKILFFISFILNIGMLAALYLFKIKFLGN